MGRTQFPRGVGRTHEVAGSSHRRYYSHRNQFERFRGVLELISRFEFDFRRRGKFFQSAHNVAVHVHPVWHCLHPHNSISNVVVSVTIHDDTYMCLYIYTFFEKFVNVNVYVYVYVYVHVP